ncbi:unnamed protein product [Didymodactylos carnosus]|uniref:Uncharacterized protein n=1 Tax=Didymodactylos carnosus TaxID=1234261 RepID=A0A813XKN6_9BILA|nr:unnamed protein product [Didymodactylos carnosus]CAF3658604.1 unnamed protein product [Didymodactylos carnosus]
MLGSTRLHASAEDVSKDYLSPHRVSTMVSIGANELPYEELEYDVLLNLLQDLDSGSIRKPDNFTSLHFLLLMLYDSDGRQRDRYPIWRWYYRVKKKLLIAKHLTIDSKNCKEMILTALEHIIETTKDEQQLKQLMFQGIQLEQQYLTSTIHGLFKTYTPIHTYLYMELHDKPTLNTNKKLFNIFQQLIQKYYLTDNCDLIHFAIAHKKTTLLTLIFDNINWLDLSMNLTTERGWLPLHYASFVGDKETVRTICDTLTSSTSEIHIDIISLLISTFRMKEFTLNPNNYILKACGMETLNKKHISKHQQKENKENLSETIFPQDSNNIMMRQNHLQQLHIHSQASGTTTNNNNNNNNNNNINDNDIPDADELELSSLPLLQRDEFIEKILHVRDKQLLIPSPLILACIATCGDKTDYEEIVKILLDSHLVEFDGLNHDCILTKVLDYMQEKQYAQFQRVQVFRDTEQEGPSAFIFYQFDGFIVNQDIKPLSGSVGKSGSSMTITTSKYEESASDDGHNNETPISVRCFLTVLVLRDIFIQYPRWDFHLLRENIEEHFSELEQALGCRPTILYPDGDIISSRKRSDVTWEVIMKYRLSSEAGQSVYMQVDYYFFESFGDPLADALANIYQTPFYLSCMTDSTVMMDTIFDNFFKRRHLHCWGTIAQRQLEHCFDGVLQIKNNCTTFLSLCTTLSHYYQVENDPFMEENSSIIQRIFVHAFACCVRRNAKIELDYLIKNHALIYYDSCRTKPSDIRHNILTYCVVRNLVTIFDQLMNNMKMTMYKTYQNSTNPDWQPHIAWREIIHVIIDPVLQQTHEQNEFSLLACYGDNGTNFSSTGSVPILHSTGEEYIRCIKTRDNIISKAKRKLPRALSDINKRETLRRRISLDQDDTQSHSVTGGGGNISMKQPRSGGSHKSHRNIFKNVNNRLKFGIGGKNNDRNHILMTTTTSMEPENKTSAIDDNDASVPTDAISLLSVTLPKLKDRKHLSFLDQQLYRWIK